MIQVHHLGSSRSHRVLWLLEELDLEYDLISYERDPATYGAPAELHAVHPLGKSPVLKDGSLTLAESGAIVEYVVNRYGGGRLKPPPGTNDAIQYLYWSHFAEGSAMPALILKLYLKRLGQIAAPVTSRVEAEISLQLAYMEAALARSLYFAGAMFTAADIQMGYVLEAAVERGGLDQRYPNLLAFLERVQQRRAYKAALRRGGVLQLAG
jgi:glutathione S-transferase